MNIESAQENCMCGYPLAGVYSGRCPECGRNVPVNRGSLISQYTERRLDRRLIYYLYPDTLVIHGRTLWGMRFVSPVSLARLDPNIYTVWERQPALKVGGTLVSGSSVLILVSLFNRDDKTGIQLIVLWACLIVGFFSLILSILTIRNVEHARFCLFERPIVSIGRVGPDVDRFNDFIAQVRKTILAYRNIMENKSLGNIQIRHS